MRLENSFDVDAPASAAWRLLNDVPAVVPCMPGAELVEVVGENAWKASMKVKLGPIALQFLADVTREEMDEAAGRVALAVKARESRGRGNAEATIESTVSGAEAGTRVDVVTELALRGAVAQYGRGVVADVASQMTGQFAQCIARKLSETSSPGAGGEAAADPPPVEAAKPIGGLGLVLRALWRSLTRRRPA